MNPAVAAVLIDAGSKIALKGGRWGYGKWQKGRAEKKCVVTIMDALPDDATTRDTKEARCVAKMFCSGKAPDINTAESICHRGKKGRN